MYINIRMKCSNCMMLYLNTIYPILVPISIYIVIHNNIKIILNINNTKYNQILILIQCLQAAPLENRLYKYTIYTGGSLNEPPMVTITVVLREPPVVLSYLYRPSSAVGAEEGLNKCILNRLHSMSIY
jgi:hypothetical protein